MMTQTFKISLAQLEVQAKSRPEGYLEDVKSKGTIEGEYLEIPIPEYLKLFQKYGQQTGFQVAPTRDLMAISASIARKQAQALAFEGRVNPNNTDSGSTKPKLQAPMAEHQSGYNTDASLMRGAGDIVAKVAQPIAKGLDAVLGTKISGCGGCAKRQEKLNKMIPFAKSAKELPKLPPKDGVF